MSNRGKRSLGNHDFPYHDFYHADEQSTTISFVVGSNNIGQGKDQDISGDETQGSAQHDWAVL